MKQLWSLSHVGHSVSNEAGAHVNRELGKSIENVQFIIPIHISHTHTMNALHILLKVVLYI